MLLLTAVAMLPDRSNMGRGRHFGSPFEVIVHGEGICRGCFSIRLLSAVDLWSGSKAMGMLAVLLAFFFSLNSESHPGKDAACA